MSPDAIDRRLRDAGQLYKLGMSLGRARRLGKEEKQARLEGKDRANDSQGVAPGWKEPHSG